MIQMQTSDMLDGLIADVAKRCYKNIIRHQSVQSNMPKILTFNPKATMKRLVHGFIHCSRDI